MLDQKLNIGEKIKNLRIKRRLSIEEVSRKSGISESIIAGIEDQTVSPPLGNIIILAKVFQATVGEVLGDRADSPFCIVRSGDENIASRFSSNVGKPGGYSYKSLGHQKQNRHMEPFLVTLTPTESALAEPNQHEGEEILFVLEGQVKVRLADHTDILNPGDSIYYDSNLPHVLSCHSNEPAKIFAVIYAEKEMLLL
ncbi:MAG: cupin domain-containing protein [Smithellaceae bacterium]|nr:cupin domain-containing protein [Smithellaceae bacterium]